MSSKDVPTWPEHDHMLKSPTCIHNRWDKPLGFVVHGTHHNRWDKPLGYVFHGAVH